MTAVADAAPSKGGRTPWRTWDVAEAWRLHTEEHWSYQRIADEFAGGISKAAVSYAFKGFTNGASHGGSQARKRLLPWEIAAAHQDYYMTKMLRFNAMRERGESLSDDPKLELSYTRMLDHFLLRLERFGEQMGGEAVIYYDRTRKEAFGIRRRRNGDPEGICVKGP